MPASTDWEQHYRDQDTPWDKGAPSPALMEYLEDEAPTGKILVPGCGAGHDVRALTKASREAEVVGLDIAPSAVAKAQAIPTVGKESYMAADLFNLPADMRGAFDWVFEHTCFCAIDPSLRDAYVEAVHGALRSGGQLLGVFYLDPYDEEHRPEDERPPFGCELPELLDRFSSRFEVGDYWMPEQTYPGREDRELMMHLIRLD